MLRKLEDLALDNSFAALPADFYTRLATQAPQAPRVLHANAAAAALIGLDPAQLRGEAFLAVASGQMPLPGGDTLAAVYSGHQFGVWAGQLGDGRAHLLGEVRGPQGNWELQLKGAGRTPYSRMGDGRAVLRSSVREYLASEAMHGLGIPTTRALSLVTSEEPVMRETRETAAIVLRMAPSFVRFGSFEHWASLRRTDHLRTLVDYVIDRFYPECRDAAGEQGEVLALLREVSRRTALLMADWQAVGFCHGVMNTDNMSILGLTLDYGPFGFMDGFDLGHICNHSDSEGRYAWSRQPSVGLWNLYRLAGSFHALGADTDALRAVLQEYEATFTQAFHARMGAKLGLSGWQEGDEALVDDLLRLMHGSRADFTLTFRSLAQAVRGELGAFTQHFMEPEAALSWWHRLVARQAADGQGAEARAAAMDRVNPLYVLRNHLAEQAIRAAAAGDASEIEQLLQVLRKPYDIQPQAETYAAPAPDWAAHLEISCSS